MPPAEYSDFVFLFEKEGFLEYSFFESFLEYEYSFILQSEPAQNGLRRICEIPLVKPFSWAYVSSPRQIWVK